MSTQNLEIEQEKTERDQKILLEERAQLVEDTNKMRDDFVKKEGEAGDSGELEDS